MTTTAFSDLGIGEELLRSVGEMGFETPTPIQSAAIPVILGQSDVAGQAQTGTGKTAAFAIPVLERIDPDLKEAQALVICPTRELAVQVTGEFIKLAKFMEGVRIVPVYGGQPIQRQINHFREGPQVIVGTPGRLIDHLNRKTLILDHLKMVVLDEADEMLNMGFRDDIETILGFGSREKPLQTILFSATFSAAIKKLVKRWFEDPEMIRVEGQATAADGIRQLIVEARDSMRTEGISRLMDLNNYKKALIFCNTRRACNDLVEEIRSRGYNSDALHGELDQNVRNKVMKRFRSGKIEILIATDVAARGLDVDDIDVVFNYDIPQDPDNYVHRIGRTGRAGREGVAYTFSSGRKGKSMRFIEKQMKMKLDTIPLPSVKEVEESRMGLILEEVKQSLESGGLRPWIEQIESIVEGPYTTIEVAAALLRMREEANPVREMPAEAEPGGRRERASGRSRPNSRGANRKGGFGKKRSGRSSKGRSGPEEETQPKNRGERGGQSPAGSKKARKSETAEPFYAHFAKKGKSGKKNRRNRKS